MVSAIQIALTGLSAASKKVEASASNIANLQTAGSLEDPASPPYTPLVAQQAGVSGAHGEGLGVESHLSAKNPPFTPAYDPDSPFANADGVVGLPNVDLAEEAVNLKLAGYAYKASVSVIRTASEMEDELIRGFDRKA